MKNLCLLFMLLIGIAAAEASEFEISQKYNLWDQNGNHKVDWHDMSEDQKAFALERYKVNIEYSLQNIGKKFSEVDMAKIGSRKGYEDIVPFVTYGLIALKYQDDYYNSQMAALYFYKDWQEYKKDRDGKKSFWYGGPGDYDPLAAAIYQWKEAGLLRDALAHYKEYFDDTFLLQPVGGTYGEKQKFLKEELQTIPEVKKKYDEFMMDWENTKKLAKTKKPAPLDPAVQNHKWFYSEKRAEVLKAIEYYHINKINFMLEKALKHKDPIVAAKAKKYLDDLAKGSGEELKK